MKIPRLAVLAGLLLASVLPTAAQTLPTWQTKEEPWGSWRIINFADETGAGHEVWCRWTECNWNLKTGRAKLYVFIRGASETYTYQEHWWSTGSQSSKTSYATKLSAYEIDLATNKIVVPGTDKAFPAEDRPQLTPTGYILKVSAPTALADDLPKPKPPVVSNPKPPVRTNPKPPVRTNPKPPTGGTNTPSAIPAEADWLGKITPIKSWVLVTTDKGAFYCYIPGRPSTATLKSWLLTSHKGGACVEWSVPANDAVQTSGANKYKNRGVVTKGTIAAVDGKVVVDMGAGRVGAASKFAPITAAAFGATHVKVSPAPAAPDAPQAFALTEQERRWLTRPQREDYAKASGPAIAAAAETARGQVKNNLRPDALTAYGAALTGKKAPEVDAALASVKMWGGDVSAPVAPAGDNAEIQLSQAELDTLEKANPAAFKAYMDGRIPYTGGKAGGPFIADMYDPVSLHLLTVEARKSVPDASTKPLTQAEMDLLTPEELAAYKKSYLEPATDPKTGKVNEFDKNLMQESARLRKLIADEGRAAYKKPTNAAEFEALQPWQKKKFCADFPPTTGAVSSDTRGAEIDNRSNALDGAKATAGSHPERKKQSKTKDDSAWPKSEQQALCDKWRRGPDSVNPNPNNGGSGTGNHKVDVPLGVDKDKEAKKDNPWLKPTHLYNAAKGALLGAVIGTFFGPLGVLAGVAIGGAVAYGISKITDQ